VEQYKVKDMVARDAPTFSEGARLADILRTIAATDAMSYPVTDARGHLIGCITIADLKQSFAGEGLSEWLVAHDLMQAAPDTIAENAPLSEAVSRMREQSLDYLPVIVSKDNPICVGLLELRAVSRRLSQEILRRREKAESSFA